MMHFQPDSTPAAPLARPSLTRASSRIAVVLGALWRAYRRGARRRATVGALEALDDRALRDIGLSRSDIEPVADKLARRGDAGLRY